MSDLVDVERVAQAIYLHMSPERDADDWRAEKDRDDGRLWTAYLSCARAALAAMPRRDDRAGLLRAAELVESCRPRSEQHNHAYKMAASRIRAEADRFYTPAPEQSEQPHQHEWETVPGGHECRICGAPRSQEASK